MSANPGPEYIAAARRQLAELDPALADALHQTPLFEWRSRTGGFEGLFRMIVEQQVSLAAAAAIWNRVVEGLGGEITPQSVLSRDIETLRGFGLSMQKANYGHEIARAHQDRRIDFDHLERLSDDEAIARLIAIKGVGRWTAETFLMFCEGRMDVFPGGDIALQEAIRWTDGAALRPREREAVARAEIWRPHRSVAAHLLWGWYGAVKRGDIVLEDRSSLQQAGAARETIESKTE
ncbi:MAG TPA: DNA-3-methyladenine glycosylase [Brevundimonas sp.]|nr:DNA-3-methyladenine glycosylase [Brevundimonas sp.]